MAKSTKQLYWTDAHFCGLASQTNIYGLSKIKSKSGRLPKLLALSVNGQFISVEYQKSFDNRLIPITKEDEFLISKSSYHGPGDIEIISVDLIPQDLTGSGSILALTYLKLESHFEEKPPSAFMNIYFLPEEKPSTPNQSLTDALAQSEIQCLTLDFIPFKLMHHFVNGINETCLLLSGSDNRIHMYRQSKNGSNFMYEEEDPSVDFFFPEFESIDECITQFEMHHIGNSYRLTAVGGQSGLVTISLVELTSGEIENKWFVDLDSPITSLQIFTQYVNAKCPDFLDAPDISEDKTESSPESHTEDSAQPECKDEATDKNALNLLITSAIDTAIVYCDILKKGTTDGQVLPLSNTQDVVLCSCIMDVDFDGENEILIGTYGQILMAYKLIYESPPSKIMTSTPFQSPMTVPISGKITPPPSEEKKSEEAPSSSEKADARRRHRSMATALDCSTGHLNKMDAHELHRLDDYYLHETSLKDERMARLVRSQENLASPSPKSVYFNTPDLHATSDVAMPHVSLPDLTDFPCYRLTWTKRFPDPVMGLACDDIMGDGMLDLAVLTLKGLHIMQPDLIEVASLVLERLQQICEPGSEPDDYLQLQTELLDGETR